MLKAETAVGIILATVGTLALLAAWGPATARPAKPAPGATGRQLAAATPTASTAKPSTKA